MRVLVSLLSVVLWSLPAAAFDRSDVKPASALAGMTEDELVAEARQPCRYLALSHTIESQRAALPSDSALVLEAQNEQYQVALEYLAAIGVAAGKRHQGELPAWVTAMQEVAQSAEAKQCDAVVAPARRE